MSKEKILVLGTKWWGKWSEQLAKAFIHQGYECQHINIHELFNPLFFHHWRSKKSFLDLDINKKNLALQNIIESTIPTQMISVNVDVCSTELLQRCRHLGINTFLWLGDSPYSYNHIDQFRFYDQVAIWDDYYIQCLNFMADLDARYLPTCGDDEIFKYLDLARDIDLLFIGNAFGGNATLRARLLARLISALDRPGLKIQIYGDDNWLKMAEQYPVLSPYIKCQIVSPEQANELYNRSKIVLNIHHPQNVHSTSARTYEIALSGAFQLVEHKENVPKLFSGTGIRTFTSADELIPLVSDYLEDAPARHQIAMSVRDRATTEHTYAVRATQILDLMKAKR